VAGTLQLVKGLHAAAPAAADIEEVLIFVENELPLEGVNTLVLEFNYNFQYEGQPGLSLAGSIGKADAARIAQACRTHGIRFVPMFNCLGHQSWRQKTGPLLEKHPEFDETPNVDTKAEDFYCRSWCPQHPELHEIVFSLIDELCSATRADAFHVGMDEVFIIADDECPRCRGADPAELFAGEVAMLYEHLAGQGREVWIWGDRFLNDAFWGRGKYDAAQNGTHPAVDLVPQDIVVCDWHYTGEPPPATPYFLAGKGFPVVACPWREESVALTQLDMILDIRNSREKSYASRGLGMLQTTWCGLMPFVQAYRGLEPKNADGEPNVNAVESAACFKALFARMRDLGL
jgi:hypothetical protein